MWLLAIPMLLILYLTGLSTAGMLGPDEPRYASIGRAMARSGDWITPRLWGAAWFEKPVLLYWMTGAAFRLGFSEDLAPRVPVALLSIAFLIFFQRILAREFGERAAWIATLVLGTSAAWLGCSFIGTTDLPLSAAFSAAMLLSLDWLATGNRRRLPLAAALLGVAVLAKGLVPLILVLPLLWCGRRRWLDVLRPAVLAAVLAVAAPWYVLCYLRNGAIFPWTFFWEQHFSRFTSDALAHGQPWWFYGPVLLAAMLPWTPLFLLLVRRAAYRDPRRFFLLLWLAFGLVFFSVAKNKLPGYLLPLMPAAAILIGVALDESKARWELPAAALCLTVIPIVLPVLPEAISSGISHAPLPGFNWTWCIPVTQALMIYGLLKAGRANLAFCLLAVTITAGVVALKLSELPALDRAYSARPLWKEIAGHQSDVCVESMRRSWRYGLNYYSAEPLPDCWSAPRRWHLRQAAGQPPTIEPAVEVK